MRYIPYIALIILGAACSPRGSSTAGGGAEEPTGWIEIEDQKLTFESSGGTLTTTINCDSRWSFLPEGVEYWYSVEPTEGASGDMVAITLTQNTTTLPQSVSLRFASRDSVDDILILQYGSKQTDTTEPDKEDHDTNDEGQTTPTPDEENKPPVEPDKDETVEPDDKDDDTILPALPDKDDTTTQPDEPTPKPEIDTTPDSDDDQEPEVKPEVKPEVEVKPEPEPDKEPEPEPEIATPTLSATELYFAATGGTHRLTINTNHSWTITMPQRANWLSASAIAGSGESTITIAAIENSIKTLRRANIIIYINGTMHTVEVEQAAE